MQPARIAFERDKETLPIWLSVSYRKFAKGGSRFNTSFETRPGSHIWERDLSIQTWALIRSKDWKHESSLETEYDHKCEQISVESRADAPSTECTQTPA